MYISLQTDIDRKRSIDKREINDKEKKKQKLELCKLFPCMRKSENQITVVGVSTAVGLKG